MKLEATCNCGSKVTIEDRSTISVSIEYGKWLKAHERCFYRRPPPVVVATSKYHEPQNDPD
jgi:hypothetical protein